VAEVASSLRNYGFLAALYPEGGSFLPQEKRLLAAFARHAAVALDVATALDEAHSQEETARTLLDLSRSLAESRSADEIAEQLADAVITIVGAGRALVYLWDETADQIEVRGIAGYPEDVRESLMRLSFTRTDNSELEQLLDAQKPVRYQLETVQDPLTRKFMEGVRSAETLVVPIVVRGKLMGLLTSSYVVGGDPIDFGEPLQKRLSGLADQAGPALENLRLLQHERAAADALREAGRLKSEFLAMVSHELRTPLAAVLGMAKTLDLRTHELDEHTRREFLDAIVERGEQLHRLVDDLLLSSADVELHPARVDLVSLATNAAADAVRAAPGLDVHCEATGRAVALVDGGRLRQVMDNLIANAVKHAPGASVRVRIGRDGDRVWIAIADDGPGMGEEHVNRAFEPFYQGDSSDHRTSGGVGLGLYISRRIVESHGGEIGMRSRPGEGTQITMWVPAADHSGADKTT
jgi:signal transduction histidine kinase